MQRIVAMVCSLCLLFSLTSCSYTQSKPLTDNKLLYQFDQKNQLRYLYVTILPKDQQPKTFLDWKTLNQEKFSVGSDTYQKAKETTFNILFQEGTEAGPAQGMYGYGLTSANAVISLRGQSALFVEQKSYKIKLNEGEDRWNGQTTINLMKHQMDLSRIRNKLSFDYFTLIPNLISFRTQFVHLFVRDASEGEENAVFEDYGLFTWIEQPDSFTLRQHGLDPKGHLYKANFFEFFRYPDELKLKTDPDYDEERFELILEIKGNKDHTKLLKMLDDLNNEELDIDDVIHRHFDRENLLTWLAVTILFNNHDTNSQNFYLYSPSTSNTWYFIPWDYDKGWELDPEMGWDFPNQRGKLGHNWEFGIANYWGMVLFQRFFQKPENVQALNDKILELLKIITPQQTKAFIDAYRDVVRPFLMRDPDQKYLPGTLEQFDQMLERYITLPNEVAELYFDHIENPMPFYLGELEIIDQKLHLFWTHSFDLQGDPIHYRLQIALDPYFEQIVTDLDYIRKNYYYLDPLPAGTYYWRVIAIDRHGNEMGAFDILRIPSHESIRGVKSFILD